MKEGGIFVISLDFELYWGIFEKSKIHDKKIYFENTIKTIPKILNLFEKYNIEATWATVGFLFFENIKQLKQNLPEQIPLYHNNKISAYNYIDKSYDDLYKKYHFAPNIIQMIHNTTGQEIASHTLSHYYCLEPGQTPETFYADLKKNIDLAKQSGIHIKSLVFPRNQYNPAYEKIVKLAGIKAIRSNPDIWFWDANRKESIWKKICRTADAYIPIFNSSFNLRNDKELPVKIPASRFLRPVSKYKILNQLRIKRIKKEMTKAAKNNKIYHLWWHPHNFGNNPVNALQELDEILYHYQKLQQLYGFSSMNMARISNEYYKE